MSRESDKWNDFLTDLSRKLLTYEIQKDKRKYNIIKVRYWGRSGYKKGIEITKTNFKTFMNKIAQYDIAEQEYVKGIRITESQLSELNHILSITLKHETSVSCSTPNELVIKGNYVRFSEFVFNEESLSQRNWCRNIQTVKIFALNKIFVDKNIKWSYPKTDINIISPKWEIINIREVNLSGAHGNLSNATESDESTNEKDGKPGLPGNPGGNFVGVGVKFVNGENLRIISNGGNGGSGSNGQAGEDGIHNYSPIILDSSIPCERDSCTGNRIGLYSGLSYPQCRKISYAEIGHFFGPTTHDCEYRTTGLPGRDGESGGHGGKGAKGGYPGFIVLRELNGPSGIYRHNKAGMDGKDGLGGEGGLGGANGPYMDIKFTEDDGWRITKLIPSNLRGKPGTNGVDGAKRQGMREPEFTLPPEPAKILTEYKNYLQENLSDDSKWQAIMKFGTLELFNEFKDLEEQVSIFNDDVNLTDVYQLFLNNVRRYAMIPKPIPLSSLNKKILIYLETVTLGKIFYFNDRTDSNLIINIDEYLDQTMREIEGVRDLQMAAVKADLINSYTENYKSYIDRQIEEARYTIEQRIAPKIDNVSAQIGKEIDRLISEIGTLEKLAENDQRELIEKRNELRKAMELRELSNDLKTVEQMLSFLGPIGLSVESLIGSSAPANSSVIDDQNDHRKILRSRIQSYTSQIQTSKLKEIKNLRELLDDIAGMMNGHPDKFNDVSDKIGDMKQRLSNIDSIKFHQVLTMENELRDELRRKYLNMSDSTKEENSDGQATAAKAVMDNINKAVELYALGRDLYHQFKNDQAKVNAISATRKGEKNHQFEDNEKIIHDTLIWILQIREKVLDDISSNLYLDDKTKSSLDVESWQVPGFLEDVKSNVRKMIATFENMNDDLSNSVKLLQDTMTSMINAYKKIQDYQKEQKFIDFFASMDDLATNSSSSSSLDYLDKLLRSNYVMIKRKMINAAMKNFVFPFVEMFISDSDISRDSRLSKENFEEILSKVTEQIESSKSKIDIYRTYLNGTDYFPWMILKPFTNGKPFTGPFFVWKNSQNRDSITKLLSGRSVNVTANIKDSPSHKDAIKFSVAEFFFNARNETIQKEINDALKGFEIKARHLGDSHYRCDNKIYRMNSPVTSILYYLEKGADGESVNKSLTYIDIKERNPILSPYATWEVTLMETGKTVAFRDLEKYKDVVDLELIGRGSYVDDRMEIYSVFSIDPHYRQIEIPNGGSVGGPETSGKTSNRRSIRSADAPKDHRGTIDAPLELPSSVKCMTDCIIETASELINSSVIGTIKNWFKNESIEDDVEISKHTAYPYDDDTFEINRKLAHVDLPSLNIDHSSNRFIDSENHSSSMIENNLSVTQGNLLLIDTLLRKKNGTVYKIGKNKTRNSLNTEHAQQLAYSAFVPEHESSKNAKNSVNP